MTGLKMHCGATDTAGAATDHREHHACLHLTPAHARSRARTAAFIVTFIIMRS